MTLFFKNFKYLLKQTGIKQKYFCNSISVSVSSIWKWSQDTTPDLPQLKKIAEFFSTRLNITIKAEDLLEKDIETLVQNLPINPPETATEHGTHPAGTSSDIENRTDIRKQSIQEVFDLIMKLTEEHRARSEKEVVSFETKTVLKWFNDHLKEKDGHSVGDPCWERFVEELKKSASKK